jgi:hypothetical protein
MMLLEKSRKDGGDVGGRRFCLVAEVKKEK